MRFKLALHPKPKTVESLDALLTHDPLHRHRHCQQPRCCLVQFGSVALNLVQFRFVSVSLAYE